jgi:hypothetical protein
MDAADIAAKLFDNLAAGLRKRHPAHANEILFGIWLLISRHMAHHTTYPPNELIRLVREMVAAN